MTVAAIRQLSRRMALEMYEGKPTAETDRRLRACFASKFAPQWDRWDPRWRYRKMTIWFTKDQYLELRRQLLLSGERSLSKFLVKRLGLGGPLSRKELRALKGN